MDVVRSKLVHIGRIAGQVVVVIADHHGHLDARADDPELIENGLMGLDDVVELFGSVDESQFPEPKRVAYDEQFSFGVFFFQSLQKRDELGGVIAML